ncbi:MAG: glycosyltransferase family 2 protein [Magnetococcales bacterium]|nr:glycosyltransferase family 2 protein [Magnetococcales bacterium]
MKLLIVIPALNEEASIREIIERTLAARERIIAASPVDEVAITVVSDGSTDRTVEYARHYLDRIRLLEFERNRGYGAAIKAAWLESDADLLGFLDADGTCDPDFFAPLCQALLTRELDVISGCRMNPHSKMPPVRRVGNTLFAMILNLLAAEGVKDVASGMRVVRRESLSRLFPLPDGLHFTPAMSARAMLSADLKIAEIDMTYQERQGRSKLSVIRDGWRFLHIILKTALLYRPSALLTLAGLVCFFAATLWMLGPILHYATRFSLEEWMIYRFITGHLLGGAATLFFCMGYLATRIVALTLGASVNHWLRDFFGHPWFWGLPVGLMATFFPLLYPSLLQYLTTGQVFEHWSRFIAASFLVTTALILAVTKILDHILNLVTERVHYLGQARVPHA